MAVSFQGCCGNLPRGQKHTGFFQEWVYFLHSVVHLQPGHHPFPFPLPALFSVTVRTTSSDKHYHFLLQGKGYVPGTFVECVLAIIKVNINNTLLMQALLFCRPGNKCREVNSLTSSTASTQMSPDSHGPCNSRVYIESCQLPSPSFSPTSQTRVKTVSLLGRVCPTKEGREGGYREQHSFVSVYVC